MYYMSEKGCSFVMVTKSTCLKIHGLPPSCLRSVCRLLSLGVTHCSLLVKQSGVLVSVLQLLRWLYGSEQDVMEQTWLLCNWLSCVAPSTGPLISHATVGWALIILSLTHSGSSHSFSLKPLICHLCPHGRSQPQSQ